MRQTGEIFRSAARGRSGENTPTGARGNFDRDFADAVVKAGPTKFRLVPPSQYRTSE
jgi:hypothetical protein